MPNETEIKSSFKRKTNGYSSVVLNAKRKAKRDVAEERTAHYQSLTIEQRIKLAKSRPGNSKREIERLTRLLESAPATAKKRLDKKN
jgi:hypothetical protein